VRASKVQAVRSERSGIDVDAVEVVREHEGRCRPPKCVDVRVVLGQRLARRLALGTLRVGVGLLIDREQEVEGVQQEVPAAAGWVENA